MTTDSHDNGTCHHEAFTGCPALDGDEIMNQPAPTSAPTDDRERVKAALLEFDNRADRRWNGLVDVVTELVQAERERTRAEDIEIAADDKRIDIVGGSTGNAWGTQNRIVAALKAAQASDTARKEWLSRLTDPDFDEYEPLPQGKDK